MSTASGRVRRADTDQDFARFDVKRDVIERWEDGQRQPSGVGTFEWWYFEVRLRFGTIVVAFMDKMLTDATKGLDPTVSVRAQIGFTRHGSETTYPVKAFSASRQQCDVRIGTNRCVDGGARYRLEVVSDDINGTIELTASAPPVRIGTGHLLFENGSEDQYLGWLVAVPAGQADIKLNIGGRTIEEEGRAYHDHNWGDKPMAAAIHHWYWGRAEFGDITVIASNVTAQAAFGSQAMADIVVIDGGKIVVAGSAGAAFVASPPTPDTTTGKPLSKTWGVSVTKGAVRYVVGFRSVADLVRRCDGDAAYHRDLALCVLLVDRGGLTLPMMPVVSSYEMMWFGDADPLDAHAAFARGMFDSTRRTDDDPLSALLR